MTLTTVAGDVVSVHVDRASTDVHMAMGLVQRGKKLRRAAELLRRAQGELAKAELELLERVNQVGLAEARRRSEG